MNQKLTVNFGVRLEHEDGLQEIENRQTVAFDKTAVSPLNAIVPKTGLLAGRTINGGLIFAGVGRRARRSRAIPAAVKIAPRGGLQLLAQQGDGPARRLRPVLRAVELHHEASTARPASRRTTSLNQSDTTTGVPITSLENPFPSGLIAADRQLAGAADRHRRHDQLRRPEQGRPEGAPVLVRRAARAAAATWR